MTDAEFQKSTVVVIDNLKDQIFFWEGKLDTLKARLSRVNKNNNLINMDYARVNDIQNNFLEDDQALIEYQLSDQFIYIFMITPNNFELIRVENGSSLTEDVLKLRNALLNNQVTFFTESAYTLYRQLIKPLSLGPTIKKLKIIPDHVLGYLPFEVLLTDQINSEDYSQLPYLVKKYQCSYDYSSSLSVKNLRKNKTGNKEYEFIGFAPEFMNKSVNGSGLLAYADTIRGNVVALKGAVEEVLAIQKYFSGSYYTEFEATEEKFKNVIGKSGIIHLATHAIIDDQVPEYSKLMFSQSTNQQEDGYLHAFELNNLEINAELVTLSACNTVFGVIKDGEGNELMACS